MSTSTFHAKRRDRLRGYLLNHLRTRSGPWHTLPGGVRFVGNRALHLAGHDEFEQLASYLTERFAKRLDGPRPMRSVVLTAQVPNAFATAPLECDVVLLTKGAFDRVQELSRATAYGLHALVEEGMSDFPLVRIWGELPLDEEALYAFGSVVAHVTTAALVHHEIAHVVLGHEWAWRFNLDQAPGEAKPTQCLELDADFHAVHFTEQYLAERVARVPRDADPLNVVWHHILDDHGSRSAVVLLGFYLFLLAVTTSRAAPVVGEMRKRSHPHLVVRQLLALLVQREWSQMVASDAVDLAYFAAAINTGTANDVAPAAVEEIIATHGLDALSADPDTFKDYIEGLGKQLARYEPALEQFRRLSAESRVRWFAD